MEVKTLLRIPMRNPITLSVISPDKIGYFTLKIQILWQLQNYTSLRKNSKNSFSTFRYVSPFLKSNFREEEGTYLNAPHRGKTLVQISWIVTYMLLLLFLSLTAYMIENISMFSNH